MGYEQFGIGPWLVISYDENEDFGRQMTGQYRFLTESDALAWSEKYNGTDRLRKPKHTPGNFSTLSEMGAGLANADPRS